MGKICDESAKYQRYFAAAGKDCLGHFAMGSIQLIVIAVQSMLASA
jgi:hypothetical protein